MFNRFVPLAVVPLRWLLLVVTTFSLALTPAAAMAEMAGEAVAPQVANTQAAETDWLVMIYSDADDNVLEEDMMIDLQEAELIGSTDRVTIVAQTDRFKGSYDGMEDWTGARRLLITQDGDMTRFASEELEDLGEISMSDGETLRDFIEWAVTSYPAQKTMLILSDHGAGWPGGWGDPDPGGEGVDDVFLVDAFGDSLWLMEIDRVLGQALDNLGMDYFDVVGFDACLMSQLEVYTALAPHALYSVASEETEPALGWAYAGFLGDLAANPEMGGDELVNSVVASYIDEDMRLQDPSYVGDLSPQEAAAVFGPDSTLTAVDLAKIAPLNAALNDFVLTLPMIDQKFVAEARTYAQDYETVFGDDLPSPYIDLGHFSELIQSRTDDPTVLAAAQELDAARQAAIIAEKHGTARPGSTGIAIYFPVRQLYMAQDNLGYAEVAERFVQESQWDEFLAFHAGDTPRDVFTRPEETLAAELQALLPDQDPEFIQVLADDIAARLEEGLTAEEIAQGLIDDYDMPEEVAATLLEAGILGGEPAAGEPVMSEPTADVSGRKPLQVAPIRLSAEVAYPGAPVTVETEIIGERVGYVYSFIGRLLPEDDILIIEDQEYLFSDENIEVGGVIYPQWPEGDFTVAYDWEPVVYAVSDGQTSIRTLFSPETYGDEPTYTVEGIYTFADGSPERYARLYFRNGEMTQVFGFVGAENNGVGAPRQITPQPGDQFTVLEQGYYLAEDAEEEFYSGEFGTLTFGEEPFFIEETTAPSGNYVVGVIAEDLDGNVVETYEGLFVVSEDGVTEEGFVPFVDEKLGFALLHPATWAPVEGGDEATNRVVLTTEDEGSQMTITVLEYPDAADDVEANLAALDEVFAEFVDSEGVENLEVVNGPVDYTLGSYNAQMLDFGFESDGVAYAGEVVASTPTPGVTYVVDFVAPADLAEVLLPDLDAVLYSFDILLSGIDHAGTGALQPDFAEEFFYDDYSDPNSGLYDDAEAAEWGQGFYDPESEQYVYAMNPASGTIFDYYGDLALPDTFMLQASAQAAGALDTGFGLIFRVQDDQHFYAFSLSSDGYYLVEKANGEDLETLVEWSVADSFDPEEEALNTLAVVGTDGVYGLYVNGVEVGEFADDSYAEGSAGYMVEVFDEEAPAAFVFDDFVVGAPAE
jgi:hypothetical protein